MTRVAERMLVAGVGLIGGSVAGAARAAGLVGEVVGYGRTPENLAVARARGLVDRSTGDPAAAMTGVDLVLLAVPARACGPLAATLRPHAAGGTLLTDVASVKSAVVSALETAWAQAGPVVGAHPIAGSDAAGAGAARVDLFRGRRCILTPTPTTDPAAVDRVRRLWEGVGAEVETMDAATHDAILARVSHLPHLVAAALVGAAAGGRVAGRAVLAYAGSGFRDTTRIAASRAELWRDIALDNAPALTDALAEFRARLDALAGAVAAGDAGALERVLDDAARARRGLGGAD